MYREYGKNVWEGTEGKGRLPHRSQRLVFFPDTLEVPAPFTLRSVSQERVQRELELRHVRRQLELTALSERFRNRSMQHEYSDDIFDDVSHPVFAQNQSNTSQTRRKQLPRLHDLGCKITQQTRLDKIELVDEIFHVQTRS